MVNQRKRLPVAFDQLAKSLSELSIPLERVWATIAYRVSEWMNRKMNPTNNDHERRVKKPDSRTESL